MSTIDQVFFAAYGPSLSSESGPPNPSRPQTAAAVSADRQRTTPATPSQNADKAWYRVDPQHQDQEGAPPPHLTKITRNHPILPTESVSLEIGSWSTEDTWHSSSLVIAATMPSAASTDLNPIDEMETKAASSESMESQAATGSADESTKQEESVQEESVQEEATQEEATVNEQPNAARAPWKSLWEVDGFDWPDHLLRLRDEQSEYFRYAGEKLRDASREGLRTLAVVATREQEGCTTMAICLALAAATAGARVALLDANLGRPELGPKLGLDFSHGWQESVTGNGKLAEAAVVALDTNLTLLPLSATHRLPKLNDPRISHILREVAGAFDLLVIDAGVAAAGDGALFACGADCPVNAALVVRDLRRTSEAETLLTAARLKSLGIDAIGIAENFLPLPGTQVAAA